MTATRKDSEASTLGNVSKGYCTPEGYHYEVTSPMWEPYSVGFEPPEPHGCWALIEARTKREAIKLGVKDKDFRDWVDYARGDDVNPFKGVQAVRALCEHGVCWACPPEGTDNEGETFNCAACEALSNGTGLGGQK